MVIKDTVVSWYVKHYLMPRAQIIDTPGFVIFNVTGKIPIFARQVIMPELFFITLETNIRKELGEEGKKLLYSIGKKFGYRFAIMGNFSKRGKIPEKKLVDYINMVNKFIEGTYASNISCEIDLKIPEVNYSLKNFVVCSKIENGYILPLGAASGLLSYILNDTTIEGAHVACQGAGDNECKLVIAPYAHLKNTIKGPVFNENNLDDLEFAQEYKSMNEIRKIKSSTYSFQQFINSKLFSFKEGIILRGDQRFFIYEISGLYMLENELLKDELTKNILYETSFEVGKKMLLDHKQNLTLNDLIDLLTAFGWGDVLIIEKK